MVGLIDGCILVGHFFWGEGGWLVYILSPFCDSGFFFLFILKFEWGFWCWVF